jgi:protein ImuB
VGVAPLCADHLHGGEAAMLSEMVARLGASGLAARAAVADSWGAAHALARFGTRQILVVPSGEAAQAVLPFRLQRFAWPPARLTV